MKKKKGMTLVEVMIAMLMLAIVMVGGVSFFTNAFKVNFTYMDFANRMDHALRYVEKVKVQKRNYPTYGAFLNVGSNPPTYTLFYVDSEINDVGVLPYYYENFSPNGTIPGGVSVAGEPPTKYTTTVSSSKNDIPNQQQQTIYTTITRFDYDLVLASNTNVVIGPVPENYNKTTMDNLSNNVLVKAGTYNNANLTGDYHIKYGFDFITNQPKVSSASAFQFNFLSVSNYLKTSSSVNKLEPNTYNFSPSASYNTYRYRYKEQRYVVTVTTPYTGYIAGSTASKGQDSIWQYSNVSKNIIVKQGSYTEEDESSETEGSGGLLIEVFSKADPYRRQYSAVPNASNYTNTDKIDNITTYPTEKKQFSENMAGKTVPPPDGYSKYIAFFYEGNWKEPSIKLVNYYEWKETQSYKPPSGVDLPGQAAVAGQLTVVASTPAMTISSPSVTMATVSGVSPTANKTRVTKYRKSAYISVYPVQADSLKDAKTLMEDIANAASNKTSGKVDLNKIILDLENRAKQKGYKIIKIPFFNLYAENNNSTLCEALE